MVDQIRITANWIREFVAETDILHNVSPRGKSRDLKFTISVCKVSSALGYFSSHLQMKKNKRFEFAPKHVGED